MVEAHLTVDEVMRRWPQTLPVFLHFKLDCVGCDMAPFETIAEVAETYHIPLEALLGKLIEAAQRVEVSNDRE